MPPHCHPRFLEVAGVHFPPDAPAASIGHRALAVNLSDLAAMGATPRWALLALTLPDVDEDWLHGFAAGFHALADRYGIALVGGDVTRGPLSITITVHGELPCVLEPAQQADSVARPRVSAEPLSRRRTASCRT